MEESDLTTVTIELKNGSEYELNLIEGDYRKIVSADAPPLLEVRRVTDWVPQYRMAPSENCAQLFAKGELTGYRQTVRYIRMSEIAVLTVHPKESE